MSCVGSKAIADAVPIVREASLLVADPQVRYVGTLGGNVANGDPGNDMPAVMICLDASYRLTGRGGTRTVKARDFYQGTYATALKPDEIVTAIEIPVPPAGHGYAYEKLKRKIGDYATAAAGVILTVRSGKVATCAIALSNLADRALLAKDAAAAVVGTALEKPALDCCGEGGPGHHVAGLRHARPCRVPHRGGRRDGRAGAEARLRARQGLKERD